MSCPHVPEMCEEGWKGGGGTSAYVCLLIQYATRRRPIFCVLWLHRIFRHYLINGTMFGKKSHNIKCVFSFFLRVLLETFLILRRNKRDIAISLKKRPCKLPVIFVGF